MSARCAQEYLPGFCGREAFVFDGTVTGIGPGRTERPGAEFGTTAVTFSVNEWFLGRSASRVTVDLPPPDRGAIEGSGPEYRTCMRLRSAASHAGVEGPTHRRDHLAVSEFARAHDTVTTWRTATGD